MGNVNRADRIEQLSKSLKKHYQPTTIATDRPVLDLMLYACCLEDAKFEAADEAFAKLQQSYYDWNEVRVTTVAELTEVLSSLQTAVPAATRIKKVLQSLFECRFSFDVEEARKANLGKTLAEFEAWNGMTKFVCAFVAQNALGGHAIPVDSASLMVLQMAEIVSSADAEKGVVPGLDRAIPKAKGAEFATLLHQFAADFKANNKSAAALAVFKDLNINPKNKPVPPPPPVDPKKVAAEAAKAAAAAKAATAKAKNEVVGKGKPLTIKEHVAEDKGKAAGKGAVKPGAGKNVVADTKKPVDVKRPADPKKPIEVKGNTKTPAPKKPDPKKPEVKKVETKKPEVKKVETGKAEPKKVEPKVDKKIKAGEKKPGKLPLNPGKTPTKNAGKLPVSKASSKPSGNTKKPSVPSKPLTKSKAVDPRKNALKKIVKKKPK